ncbi:hypothetical protein SERLADRAFT_414842 [Serpula lacrymans var. lacrymans S7.9]|uniref:Uncharacterized protein n=1 Tax=Serpula lacrymans var. lacrymans (strain S7.9) TaxID=578457 RepID=F8NU01_SERL9|nr:uncharacterized protein SERLADRAFT_414842 [Serpula lacrymans var. lacrymans S7.9]EGO25128.1 hypothetical protein SERLADRAFT_414842 [Serpula lacrymans var. lacrymans S7.9]
MTQKVLSGYFNFAGRQPGNELGKRGGNWRALHVQNPLVSETRKTSISDLTNARTNPQKVEVRKKSNSCETWYLLGAWPAVCHLKDVPKRVAYCVYPAREFKFMCWTGIETSFDTATRGRGRRRRFIREVVKCEPVPVEDM